QQAQIEELHSPTMSRLNRIAELREVSSKLTKKMAKFFGLFPVTQFVDWFGDGGDSFIPDADFCTFDDYPSFLAFIGWALLLLLSSRRLWLTSYPFSGSRLRLQPI